MNLKFMLFSLAFLGLPAPVVFAHHSYSAFDMSKLVTIAGTVSEVQFKNPHVWLFVDVPAGDKSETWAIEAGGPNILIRQGWMANTLKPGDKVDLQLAPMKDEMKTGEPFRRCDCPMGKLLESGNEAHGRGLVAQAFHGGFAGTDDGHARRRANAIHATNLPGTSQWPVASRVRVKARHGVCRPRTIGVCRGGVLLCWGSRQRSPLLASTCSTRPT